MPIPTLPAYLQGTETGGLLQNLNLQQAQQQVPGQPYTPGQGTAPYGQLPPAMLQAIAANTGANGQVDYPALQRQLGLTNAQMDTMLRNPGITAGASPNGPGVSVVPSHTTDPGTVSKSNDFGVYGSNGWMSPEQLGAATNSLGGFSSSLGQGTTPGNSAGGGGGSKAETAPAGLNLSGTQGGAADANNGNPAFTNTTTPISSTASYQNPGSVINGPTAGYTGPGGVNGNGGSGVLQMQPANPQAALSAYQNTPGYQLLNAPGAYQQSPGYQYAMDQAMLNANQNASARGMLESGAVVRNMQQTASGLAQQDYGNWWNRQNQLYSDYQNRLAGLAGGPTGSADAMTAGANSAQANLQTGSNLGSLFGNQGTSGMGGIINTAAAQAGNMINAGQQQAQIGAANQATQLAGATIAATQQKPAGLF